MEKDPVYYNQTDVHACGIILPPAVADDWGFDEIDEEVC